MFDATARFAEDQGQHLVAQTGQLFAGAAHAFQLIGGGLAQARQIGQLQPGSDVRDAVADIMPKQHGALPCGFILFRKCGNRLRLHHSNYLSNTGL